MNVLPVHVAKQAELLHRADPHAPFILIRAALQPPVETVPIGDSRAPVTQCVSPLGVRAAMQTEARDAEPRVILFSGDESELGHDLLARSAKRRLQPIDPWSIVATMLRVVDVDPALRRMPWVADLLIEAGSAAAGGPSTVLEAERAWAIAERQALALPHSPPDDEDLYLCSLDANWRARWLALPAPARQGLRERWNAVTKLAGPLCDAIEAGHAERLLAAGLLCDALRRCGVDQTVAVAQSSARLEPLLGGQPLDTARQALLARAAVRHVATISEVEADAAHAQLVALAREVHAEPLIEQGRFGRAAFDRALSDAGRAIDAAATEEASLVRIEPALAAVRELVWPRADEWLLQQLDMARRLVHWSLSWNEPGVLRLEELADRYANEEAWIDWARTRLRHGAAHHELASAFDRLAKAVAEKRTVFDRTFAEQLAATVPTASPLPLIEHAVADLIVPALADERALFIVLDGMSLAACIELTTDLARQGWTRCRADRVQQPRAVLTMLPSTTEASRASLLCGRACRGDASAERAGFSRHPALMRVAISGKPPQLFHKAGLGEAGDARLAGDLLTALRDARQRHVAVVLNAIDDHLAKSDQLRLRWTVDQLRWLDSLLGQADAANRVVVLLSDHGHVLDRGAEQTTTATSGRWRQPDLQRFAGEVEIAGERIRAASGLPAVVLAWDERVRYTARRNGYHGGANPAECLAPLVMLQRADRLVGRWQTDPLEPPAWW